MTSSNINEIKNNLIMTCQTCDIKHFKDSLYDEIVETVGSNKESFEKFFRKILNTAKPINSTKLDLKIESGKKSEMHYCFFEHGKVFPSITLILIEKKRKLVIDLLPF